MLIANYKIMRTYWALALCQALLYVRYVSILQRRRLNTEKLRNLFPRQ